MTEPFVEEIAYPERDWGDDEPAPEVAPTVLVASGDAVGDPIEVPARNAKWRGVMRAARKLGWTVRLTYALAWSPDVYHLNGNLRKAAHHTHSVALRMVRGAERAVCVWWRESALADLPLNEWTFKFGMHSRELRTLGANEFKGAL